MGRTDVMGETLSIIPSVTYLWNVLNCTKLLALGWGCSSVVESLVSIQEALRSSPSKEAKKLGSRKTKTQTGLPKEFLAKASLGNITSFR